MVGIRRAWIGCCVLLVATAGADDDAHKTNVGQSFAHPLSRLDLRIKYVDFSHRRAANILTARLDRPFNLTGGWKLNTRVSMTSVISDLPGRDNPQGSWQAGTGDLFTQLMLIAPQFKGTSFGFGTRAFFPTAGQDQLGRGKYRIAPFVVAMRFPDWLPPGSFLGLGLRNEFSYAGDPRRRDINELQIVPFTTINLPHQSFISLFPTIQVSWAEHNRVFVPLDLELGRKLGTNRVASLRMQLPVKDELDPYDWTLEARIAFFF